MTNSQTKESKLLGEICKIFNVFPEELEYNLPGGIGIEKARQLLQLLENEKTESYKKGYIAGGIDNINTTN